MLTFAADLNQKTTGKSPANRYFTPTEIPIFFETYIEGRIGQGRTFLKVLRISIEICEPKTFVKVKAHTRLVNGKAVRIRSHYRRVLGKDDK